MPDIQINIVAIVLAVIANFFLGFVWYSFFFRQSWAREMGFDPNESPDKSVMIRGMSLSVLGNLLLAWVFFHNIAVWNPVTWGLPAVESNAFATAGEAAFFTWIGFYVPVLFNSVAWEKKSWKLFGINASYHFVSLLLVATIITLM